MPFILSSKSMQGPRADWFAEMGSNGIISTFLVLGAVIGVLVYIMSQIDKRRRRPGRKRSK